MFDLVSHTDSPTGGSFSFLFKMPRKGFAILAIGALALAGANDLAEAAPGGGKPKPDRRAPSVSISSPASGTTYSTAQAVTISASASDNVGVTQVEFYQNGVLRCTDTTSPYTCGWSFTSANNGSHSWTARAYDAAGNNTTSSPVSLSVQIDGALPTVSISDPTSGTTYTTAQTVSISAVASDDVGVTKVEFYQNGVLRSTKSSAPFSHAWSISNSNNGHHTWTSKAYDAAGNTASCNGVTLTVDIDGTAPTVSISSPASGTTYTSAQTVTIAASASDNVGVSKVEFYQNGVLRSTDSSAPFTHSWSFTSANNGSHGWTARAFDAAGNTATSSAVSLTVNIATADTQAPTVSISSPASGTTYTSAQTVTISASASDNVGVSKVEFYQNGALRCTDTTSPYTCGWSFTSADNGSHTWTAKAYDAAGNTAISAINLNVNIAVPDTEAPTVSISSPTSGTNYTSAQTVTITASASDNVGVSKVEFYNGTTLKGTATTAPYSYAWSITGADNGSHGWTAKAYDAAGNSKVSSAVSLTVNIATAANPGAHLWSLQFGGPTEADVAWGMATAIDPWGDVVVLATVRGSVDFGDGPQTNQDGVALAKYSADGQIARWSRWWTKGTSITEFEPRALVVNADGSVVVVGYFYGTIGFEGATLTSGGGYDLFLVKYAADGQRQWARRFGGAGSEFPTTLAVDAAGNLYVTGHLQGSANLGGSTLSSVNGSRDVFLAKYSASGAHLWSKAFGGSSRDEGWGVAVDGGGNPWITGSFEGTIDFGSGPLTSAGSSDVFVAGFAANGGFPYAWREGGAGRAQGRGIAFDGLGNLVLAASFEGAADFAGQTLISAGGTDIALAQYTAGGNPLWARRFGGSYLDLVNGLAVNAAGEIAITGTFVSSINLGGGALTLDGSYNVFLAKYDVAGAHRWSKVAGLNWDDKGNGIALDDAGEVVATGLLSLGVDFGGGLLTASQRSPDGFLVRFAP